VGVALPALLLVALAWAAVVALLRDDLADDVNHAQRENANLALAFEEHCLSTIRSVNQVLQFVALQYKERGKMDLGSIAGPGRVRHDVLITISITDPAGKVIAGSSAGAEANLADRAFFVHHRDHDDSELLVSAPVQGRISGRNVIPMSRRIALSDGSFGGIIVAGVDPAYFEEFYGKLQLGRDGMVTLAGFDGTVRARRTGMLKPAAGDLRGSTLLKRQALADSGNYVTLGNLDGVRRYTSYRTLREFGLVVAVGTSEEDVLAAYLNRRNAYLAAATIFSVLVALFAALALITLLRRRQFLDKTRRSEARFRATFDQAAIGMAHVGLDGKFLKVNDALCKLAGCLPEDLLGRRVADLRRSKDGAVDEDTKAAPIDLGSVTPVEREYLRQDGTTLWATISPALVRDPEGRPDYFVAMVQDTTERKVAQDKVLHQAQFDLLTDLPNRALFADRLAQALNQARRQKWHAAVLFIDLDRFKSVNDTLGHAAGDVLLHEIGRRLAGLLRKGDTVARIGGDEFAVVLAQLTRAEDAGLVAEKILRVMAVPMLLEGHEHVVTASIGIALFPDHGQDEVLVQHADAAMFESKQAGSNTYRIYGGPAARAA
jgi:diguanylate cyclase (GGDEF)-like protein/PAS domain S-box-containing protein